MKMMTCKQLGGACDEEFRADTFEEMASQSQNHGKAMFEQQDPDHLAAMEAMRELMQEPEKMQQWFDARRQEFNDLPEL